jgi:hypothetical protein
MLTSLFGDLQPLPGSDPARGRSPRRHGASGDFAATAILESHATEVNDLGRMVDRHTRDLFVTGSPTEAIRRHLAASRADLGTASRQITLYDPSRMWAASVVKALSDASGQPIEKLHLRRQDTLSSIALIERTELPRRLDDPLKVYHADVREPTPQAQMLPVALMERSHLVAVILAPMDVPSLEDVTGFLLAATHGPHWVCPNLLFMLSAPMAGHAPRLAAAPWPERLHVEVSTEPMTSASAVWNTVLQHWHKLKATPQWDAPPAATPAPPASPAAEGPVITATRAARLPESTSAAAGLDAGRVQRVLGQLMQIEGLLGCCIVDSGTGLVLGEASQEDVEGLNLGLAAATSTEVLKAHQRAAREMGRSERIDEIIVSQGARHQVLRTVASHPDLFVLGVLDRHHTNLALARYRIMEAEKSLG